MKTKNLTGSLHGFREAGVCMSFFIDLKTLCPALQFYTVANVVSELNKINKTPCYEICWN